MSNATPFDFEQARFNMIEQQIRPWEVLDSAVLSLLNDVHREDFVPAAYRHLALADLEIPLATAPLNGRSMLPPRVEARLLQDLALQAHEQVLHIGTGSGYLAALMSRQCRQVVSLEIDPALAAAARERLQAAGIDNVEVRATDAAAHGFAACTTHAPWDVIVLSGSIADVPNDLLELLRVGGRLWAVTGSGPVQRATLVRRHSDTGYLAEQPWDTALPRLCHFPEPSRFSF